MLAAASTDALAWALGLGVPLSVALVGWCAWVVKMLMRIDRTDAKAEGVLLALSERIQRDERDHAALVRRVADLERWLGPTPGRRQT